VSTPIQHAAVAGFEISPEMEEYFEITRNIHRLVGDYVYHKLNEIEGVKANRPEATFYLLADFNSYSTELQKLKINTSQKLSEALIVHPYHTAIVGGDSLVLERTDYRARIAFVDYNGPSVYENYKNQKPKTPLEKSEFVEKNAPRVVGGIKMLARFFEDIKKEAVSTSLNKRIVRA